MADAALELIDEHGLDALTLRALGQATGMHHTAVYRHFSSRNDVLAAVNAIVVQSGLDRVVTWSDDPRERLLSLIRALRAAMREHPAVTPSLLQPDAAVSISQSVVDFQSMVIGALSDMGLAGHALLIHHRLLESYVLGASVFDFGGAPGHLESRRQRMREIPDAAFEEVSRDVASIDAVNEEAFDRGLVILVDVCVEVGARGRPATDP